MHVMPQGMSHTDQRIAETACLALGVAIVLTAIGTYAADGESNDTSILSFVLFAAVLAGVVAAIYRFGVRRAETQEDAHARAKAAMVFAVCAVVSIAVFWTGLPVPLAAAAALLAYDARNAGDTGVGTLVSLCLAGLATGAAVLLAFVG